MDVWDQIARLRREGTDAVVVTVAAARGSVPGETGSKAVVTAAGRLCGNLGGGKVEARALETALDLLASGDACRIHTWNLQRDVGMTCGGEMTFVFERVPAAASWHIVVFGAGHVSQALVPLLAGLACRVDVIDPRPEWLERIEARPNVVPRVVDAFEAGVDFVGPSSFVLSITRGHASDAAVLRAVLRRHPALPFVGAIGSAAKRAVLLRELRETPLEESLLERIVCPLGLPVGGNDPAEIAISVAAQLLGVRDAMRLGN